MSASTLLENGLVKVTFASPWDIPAYRLFLKTKDLPEFKLAFDEDSDSYSISAPERFAHLLGLQSPTRKELEFPMADYLFDYEQWIIRQALIAKRFAIWADCGLGKTAMALEWMRHIQDGGRILICCPNKIVNQWSDEARKFYGDSMAILRLNSRDELKEWCVAGIGFAITNHEKFTAGPLDECRHLHGLILDESSILKSGMGKIKRSICESAKGVQFKLSLSATPAPNDTTEYVTQAEFLETGGREMLAEYFYRNYDGATWILRPHAKDAFYRFMASWSIYLRKPSAYGFKDQFDVPEPEIVEQRIAMNEAQLAESRKYAANGGLFNDEKLGVTARSKLSQIAKGFIYRTDEDEKKSIVRIPSEKPEVVAALVQESLKEGRQSLVWTVFDEESEILAELLRGDNGVETLHGKDSDESCDGKLERFRNGEIRCLISKARLLGYGMNFQFCTRMIFSGFDDSFEAFYQAVRRAHRYGQTERIKIFVPYIFELESHMWNNLLRKKSQWESDIAKQESNYVAAFQSS